MPKPRTYKTFKNADRYADKLRAELTIHEDRMITRYGKPSKILGYSVVNHGWLYAVAAKIELGDKIINTLCA